MKQQDEPIDLRDVLERLEGDQPLLDELLVLFLADCPPKLDELRRALELKDMESVRLLGHALKGAAANLSLGPLREAAFRAECAGKEVNIPEAGNALERLTTEFERLKKYLAQRAGSPIQAGKTQKNKSRPQAAEPRILAVDDAKDTRALFSAWAEQAEIGLDTASGGLEALHLVKAKPYRLILLDLNLPGQNGPEILAAIRDVEKSLGRAPSRVIALTASSFPGERKKCSAAGFDGFLLKPLLKDRFLALLGGASGEGVRNVPDVPVDDSIQDLIPGYLENRRRDWRKMDAALKEGDFASLESTAHQIKGSAASFGFVRMGEICRDLEKAARDKQAAAAGRALRELKAELDRLNEA